MKQTPAHDSRLPFVPFNRELKMMIANSTSVRAPALPGKRITRLARFIRRAQNEIETDSKKLSENLKGNSSTEDKPQLDLSQTNIQDAEWQKAKMATSYRAPGTFLLPAFTRRREVLAGRWAMFGVPAALAWEIFHPAHPGPMAATSLLTGLSPGAVEAVFFACLAHGIFAAVSPTSPTYSKANQQDIAKRPEGFPGKNINPVENPTSALGISGGWGFTKKNELFVGRMAMLGFLSAVIGEMVTGYGVVGQVVKWAGNSPTAETYTFAAQLFAVWAVFSTASAFGNGNMGELQGDDDVY